MNTAEDGRRQRSTCSLECWLGGMNTYSASRARDMGRYGEIWGDIPLLGSDATPARVEPRQRGHRARGGERQQLGLVREVELARLPRTRRGG